MVGQKLESSPPNEIEGEVREPDCSEGNKVSDEEVEDGDVVGETKDLEEDRIGDEPEEDDREEVGDEAVEVDEDSLQKSCKRRLARATAEERCDIQRRELKGQESLQHVEQLTLMPQGKWCLRCRDKQRWIKSFRSRRRFFRATDLLATLGGELDSTTELNKRAPEDPLREVISLAISEDPWSC
ncbi:unnamed protein product [Protopolystoma xenopodis]|uniref:Uncharacterized protein n=1 Tax=Protopolystoma xenopodis TaxID=117903 RepID=A0A3S5BTC9_9PLAT|nr:unnamed protein product [Protopolystoma xenopodis]